MNQAPAHPRSSGSLPRAKIEKSRLAWAFWLVPLAAAGLCVWFVFRDFVAAGPAITIYFENVEGLEAQKTEVRFRGAQVGEVKTIRLAGDGKRVEVRVQLTGAAKNLARVDSVFWIVRPEVKIGAISGLRTIISGEFIAVQPGIGPPAKAFTGAEKEPVIEKPGALPIILTAAGLESLQEQSPIYYRGIQVGEVLSCQLAPDARQVVIQARIYGPYAPLVTMESKFWNVGGLNVHFGLFKGLDIGAESPRAIVNGGIEFATPPDFKKPATNGAIFPLNEKPQDEWKKWAPAIRLHLSVTGS